MLKKLWQDRKKCLPIPALDLLILSWALSYVDILIGSLIVIHKGTQYELNQIFQLVNDPIIAATAILFLSLIAHTSSYLLAQKHDFWKTIFWSYLILRIFGAFSAIGLVNNFAYIILILSMLISILYINVRQAYYEITSFGLWYYLFRIKKKLSSY